MSRTGIDQLERREGPGTELKRLLARHSIRSVPDCKCEELAQVMDSEGETWVLRNIEYIVDHMEREAHNRRLLFNRLAAKLLVRMAVNNSLTRKQSMIRKPLRAKHR